MVIARRFSGIDASGSGVGGLLVEETAVLQGALTRGGGSYVAAEGNN
jgi:hypothetical protein